MAKNREADKKRRQWRQIKGIRDEIEKARGQMGTKQTKDRERDKNRKVEKIETKCRKLLGVTKNRQKMETGLGKWRKRTNADKIDENRRIGKTTENQSKC